MSLSATHLSVADALDRVAASAADLDQDPRFPAESFDALAAAGLTGMTVPITGGHAPLPALEEWEAVRSVARADGSVGRIYDGHLNAVERLALCAPEPLRSRELDRVRAGEARLGVWGADPRPAEGEGEPARLAAGRVHGAKVFCSGAGGLDAALVLVRGDQPGPPLLAYVDLTENVEVDRSWYRAAGMRSSESHRVVFHGAQVLAVLGEPGELSREPWFGRDAIRTAACWAGLVDAVREEALGLLAERVAEDDLAALAAGRMIAHAETVDALLASAARLVDEHPQAPAFGPSVGLRAVVAHAARDTVEAALAALGSRPLAAAGRLDRARRDLEVFLHQHRLDPLLARVGREAGKGGARR